MSINRSDENFYVAINKENTRKLKTKKTNFINPNNLTKDAIEISGNKASNKAQTQSFLGKLLYNTKNLFEINKKLMHYKTLQDARKITQIVDSSNCSTVAILNGIAERQDVLNDLIENLDFNPKTGEYTCHILGESFTFKLNEGENVLQKIYDAYQCADYGLESGGFAMNFMREQLPNYNDVLLRANSDNLAELTTLANNGQTILTFNTTNAANGLTPGHSYTVKGIDGQGIVELCDPLNPDVTIKIEYDKLTTDSGAQFEGVTKLGRKVDDGLSSNWTRGGGIQIPTKKVIVNGVEYSQLQNHLFIGEAGGMNKQGLRGMHDASLMQKWINDTQNGSTITHIIRDGGSITIKRKKININRKVVDVLELTSSGGAVSYIGITPTNYGGKLVGYDQYVCEGGVFTRIRQKTMVPHDELANALSAFQRNPSKVPMKGSGRSQGGAFKYNGIYYYVSAPGGVVASLYPVSANFLLQHEIYKKKVPKIK